jgi:hypothetical protein
MRSSSRRIVGEAQREGAVRGQREVHGGALRSCAVTRTASTSAATAAPAAHRRACRAPDMAGILPAAACVRLGRSVRARSKLLGEPSMTRRLIAGLISVAGFAGTAAAQSAPAAPTFAKDVAPIMFAKCANCHRAGEVAPMSLLSYQEARPWARAIKAKVASREMPPWGANPALSLPMRNDVSLSDKEIATLVAWADAGAPRGNDADLPPAPTFVEGWTYGREPDVVLEMPVEFEIPAEGELGVQTFFSKIPFTEDKFAEVLELRPGNRSVVHHSGVFVVDIPEARRSWTGASSGPMASPSSNAPKPACRRPIPARCPAPRSCSHGCPAAAWTCTAPPWGSAFPPAST